MAIPASRRRERHCPVSNRTRGLPRRAALRVPRRSLGVDVTAPRLSWIVESNQRGQKQTAYQVLVASDERPSLRQGRPLGQRKSPSDETTAIVYAGKPLRSHQPVTGRSGSGTRTAPSAWSKPAFWSMGLLDPATGSRPWIGSDKSRQCRSHAKLILPPPAYLRTTFRVEKPVRARCLYATALGIFDVHLNGHRVSDDYFNPGWTDYTKRVYYRAYDVTEPGTRRRKRARRDPGRRLV